MNLLSILLAVMILSGQVIFDFTKESDLSNWVVIDDVVMGGRSGGTFSLSNEGHGVFSGRVSLENNGGFSSVQYRFRQLDIKGYSSVRLILKGDGKIYQFRVKSEAYDRYSYITEFRTTNEWQEVELKLADLYPSFRGMRLNSSNYPGEKMEEISFLISNKKNESFRLEIDRIELLK